MNTLILKKWLSSHTLQGPKFDNKIFDHSLYMKFRQNLSEMRLDKKRNFLLIR
jgi:hypothetical protein